MLGLRGEPQAGRAPTRYLRMGVIGSATRNRCSSRCRVGRRDGGDWVKPNMWPLLKRHVGVPLDRAHRCPEFYPMTRGRRWPVILLPGGILPAQPAYQRPLAELGEAADARTRDLEMYAAASVPPPGYSLETEVEGIEGLADGSGFDTPHLVGDPAGGASSLAFAASYPERLRSLTLMEPARTGRTGQTSKEAAVFDPFRTIPGLPPDKIMPVVIETQLAPLVEPPASLPGPRPTWMPSRLLAIGGFLAAFDADEPDVEVLRAFDRPVYFALGGRGNPGLYARIAARLGDVFSDFMLDVHEDRHHFRSTAPLGVRPTGGCLAAALDSGGINPGLDGRMNELIFTAQGGKWR